MSGLLFLVSIFSSFELDKTLSASTVATQVLNPGIEIEFETSPHLSVGDPVFFKGQPVGSISSIEIRQQFKLNENSSIVKVKLTDTSVSSSDNLIALVAKIKVKTDSNLSKKKSVNTSVRSAVELMRVAEKKKSPSLNSQSKVHGFVSFEEFWNSTARVSL